MIVFAYPNSARINIPATIMSIMLAKLFRKGRDFAKRYKIEKEMSTGPQLKLMVNILRAAIISNIPKSMTIML
ncbi:MAG: hypothetical protein QT08_C0014G0035 [archaeon GW2011_AR17]|nr:MAG: hypothetical protein QT08_C0014G0035 [archaeon GW2011_AR17]